MLTQFFSLFMLSPWKCSTENTKTSFGNQETIAANQKYVMLCTETMVQMWAFFHWCTVIFLRSVHWWFKGVVNKVVVFTCCALFLTSCYDVSFTFPNRPIGGVWWHSMYDVLHALSPLSGVHKTYVICLS